ncbi:MAG TPA: carbon-nitrogen hydrolase family protein [Sedimentisphaerales bacterium]|nr:carbon-nitrogen hydrolase family protein [Sedimentisphaerales bacterium]
MAQSENVSRRQFIGTASAALGAGLYGTSGQVLAAEGGPKITNKADRLPREVWVASFSLGNLSADTPEQMVSKMLKKMEEVAPYQPDIVCLTELFAFMNTARKPPLSQAAEEAPGPICKRIGEYAKQHNCYVICPTHTKQNGRFYCSSVLIDRQGGVVGEYHKIHPTVDEIKNGVAPGVLKPPVFKTDFGTIGMQICFDANWYDGWRYLRKAGAEIVFWSSAYPGGKLIDSLARLNKYPIVTSTRSNPTRVIDVTGDESATSGRFNDWVCVPVNLEKAAVHIWPYVQKFSALRAKYGRKLSIKILDQEDWAVVESRSADIKIADVLKEFDIPTFEEHIVRAEKVQDKHR